MNNPTSQLSFYLRLQYRRGIRALKDNGIYPWLAIPLILTIFVFITYRLLNGFAYGEFLYPILGLSISSSMADSRRVDFIKSISHPGEFRLIRLSEQLVIITPFIIGLLIFGWTFQALGLFIIGIIVSFLDKQIALPFALPTPFGKRPFEFSRGFRNAFLVILGCYILVPLGLSVDNFNLAIASIAGIGLASGNYFIQPEPRFYVWIHNMNPSRFLLEKSKTILHHTLISVTPPVLALLYYYPDKIGIITLLVLSAIAFTIMCMLAKYLAYPSDINIIAGFAMGISIFFPPLMLIIIPVFYFKAINRLLQVLR